MTPAFEPLLAQLRAAFESYPALSDFCPIPDDLRAVPVAPRPHPAHPVMQADPMADSPLPALCDQIKSAGDVARWRETYKDTPISPDFMERFGCYCIVGQGGAWISDHWAAYIVYMPPDLDYPRHEHPAEELYFIVAGKAEFQMGDAPYKTIRAGDSVFHPSGIPHATRTTDASLLALVFWRNHFGTPPVWSPDVVFS